MRSMYLTSSTKHSSWQIRVTSPPPPMSAAPPTFQIRQLSLSKGGGGAEVEGGRMQPNPTLGILLQLHPSTSHRLRVPGQNLHPFRLQSSPLYSRSWEVCSAFCKAPLSLRPDTPQLRPPPGLPTASPPSYCQKGLYQPHEHSLTPPLPQDSHSTLLLIPSIPWAE